MLGLILASCGGNTIKAKADNENLRGKWELSVLDGKTITGKQQIYIELTNDNRVTGFAGCNRLTGTYALEKANRIRFIQLATTRMACPEMGLEAKVLAMLNNVENFVIENEKLMLTIDGRAPFVIFTKMNENDIVNKYWKLKALEGKSIKMVNNQEREQYFILRSDNTITGFAGCNHFSGEYQLIKGNRIRFNTMATTMRLCPDVNVNETDYLKVFGSADNYAINGDTLVLNAGGRAPLAVFESVDFD